VLEVGRRTGHSRTLMQKCEIRCGLDYFSGMLDKARQRDESLGLMRGTATRLRFHEDACDFVFCVYAPHHSNGVAAFIYQGRCGRRLAARAVQNFVGREVLKDPVLHKNGTSQLSLLPEDAFAKRMARILEALDLSERRGLEILFPSDIALPMVFGFVPDAIQSPVHGSHNGKLSHREATNAEGMTVCYSVCGQLLAARTDRG
jgi:hypothetical protein